MNKANIRNTPNKTTHYVRTWSWHVLVDWSDDIFMVCLRPECDAPTTPPDQQMDHVPLALA
jgi:hypothetical protein